LASADWMNRNLFRRVEQMAPIEDPDIRKRVMIEAFDIYLADNTHTWELQSDGNYVRIEPGTDAPVNAQVELMAKHAEHY
jgi:polyphosphate kinase